MGRGVKLGDGIKLKRSRLIHGVLASRPCGLLYSNAAASSHCNPNNSVRAWSLDMFRHIRRVVSVPFFSDLDDYIRSVESD